MQFFGKQHLKKRAYKFKLKNFFKPFVIGLGCYIFLTNFYKKKKK